MSGSIARRPTLLVAPCSTKCAEYLSLLSIIFQIVTVFHSHIHFLLLQTNGVPMLVVPSLPHTHLVRLDCLFGGGEKVSLTARVPRRSPTVLHRAARRRSEGGVLTGRGDRAGVVVDDNLAAAFGDTFRERAAAATAIISVNWDRRDPPRRSVASARGCVRTIAARRRRIGLPPSRAPEGRGESFVEKNFPSIVVAMESAERFCSHARRRFRTSFQSSASCGPAGS